jgi:hypothetical protein
MAKRSPEEVLATLDAWDAQDAAGDDVAALDDAALDAEMERVLAMSQEDCERELREAGIDVEGEKAAGRDWREKAERGEIPEAAAHATRASVPEVSGVVKTQTTPDVTAPASPAAPVVPIGRPKAVRILYPLAAAAAAVVGLAGLTEGALLVADRLGGSDHPVATPNPEAVRRDAFAACDAKRWADCLRMLDEARRYDSDGDRDPRVREYRQRAEAGIKGP